MYGEEFQIEVQLLFAFLLELWKALGIKLSWKEIYFHLSKRPTLMAIDYGRTMTQSTQVILQKIGLYEMELTIGKHHLSHQ